MNKFLKGALACAAIVPCLTGFVGCAEKEDKTEVAYKEVFAEVEAISNKFSTIETVGTEFQLNINMAINAQQLVNDVVSPDGAISTNLKAVLGARHSQTNKEIFGDISIVGEGNYLTSILSAYMVDDIGEDEYAEVGTLTETQWNALKDALYINIEGVYVVANTTFDATATYYMATEDLVHVYMNSNISALNAEIGFDITEMIPLSDGKMYGPLYIGDDLVEDDTQSGTESEDAMDIESMLSELPTADDYETFKQELANSGMELTRVENNGDVGIKISGEGNNIEIVAKANGGLRVALNMIMPIDSTTVTAIDVVMEIDVVDEIEESYIPTNLTGYGDSVDLEAWFERLMSELPM